jgi:hypothetical protein
MIGQPKLEVFQRLLLRGPLSGRRRLRRRPMDHGATQKVGKEKSGMIQQRIPAPMSSRSSGKAEMAFPPFPSIYFLALTAIRSRTLFP